MQSFLSGIIILVYSLSAAPIPNIAGPLLGGIFTGCIANRYCGPTGTNDDYHNHYDHENDSEDDDHDDGNDSDDDD
jgi:hypothetical protein